MRVAVLVCFFIFLISSLTAQEFSLKISKQEFSIGETSYEGFSTKLPYPYAQIKKEWWRYIKKIAHLENHKTHYVIIFPASQSDSNSDLLFVSMIENNEDFTTIKMAVKDQSLNDQFESNAKNILLGFKLKYYTSLMQKKIGKSEKKAYKISQTIDSYKKKVNLAEMKKEKGRGNRNSLTKDIRLYKQNQDSLNVELQSVQIRIDQLRNQLNNIK